MTDHDDTPSTEERERARAELRHEGQLLLRETEGRDTSRIDPSAALIDKQVERNRLAARVASLETELLTSRAEADGIHADRVRLADELRPLRAKLRAAAAPVELPEGWRAHDEDTCVGPDDETVTIGKSYVRVQYNASHASTLRVPEAVLRHLLALPPQEDVRGALPDGFSLRMCRSATDGPCDTYSYETRLYADRRAHVSIRPDWTIHQAGLLPGEMEAILRHHLSRPTAPRTEGGGDHGE